MTPDQKKLAEQIYEGLSKQAFFDWYGEGGKFEEHIQDSSQGPSKEDILQDILKLFQIKECRIKTYRLNYRLPHITIAWSSFHDEQGLSWEFLSLSQAREFCNLYCKTSQIEFQIVDSTGVVYH